MAFNKGVTRIWVLQILSLLPVMLVAAVMMLWSLAVMQSEQEQELLQAQDMQLNQMQQVLHEHYQLHSQTAKALASTDWIAEQMLFESSRQEAGETLAAALPWVEASYLIAADQMISRDDQLSSNLSYRELTAIDAARRGVNTFPELLQRPEGDILYWSLPIHHQTGTLLGALHLVIAADWMFAPLQEQASELGSFRLMQQFPGAAPQAIVEVGQGFGPIQKLSLPHSYWSAEFSASAQPREFFPLLNIGLQSIILLFVIALLCQIIAVQLVNRWYLMDLQRLSGWMQRIVLGQKTELGQPHFPIFDDVRRQVELSLSRDDKSISAANDLTFDAGKLTQAESELDELLLGGLLAGEPSVANEKPRSSAKPVPLRDQIVRFADIRGIYGVDVDDFLADGLARAMASEMIEQGEFRVVLAHDNRPSSPALYASLVAGFTKQGLQVVDLGLQPLPVLHFYMHMQNVGAAVMVTASQSAPEFNGFKCFLGQQALVGMNLQALWRRVINQDFVSHDGHASVQKVDPQTEYIKQMMSQIRVKRLIKVVVNCSAGVSTQLVRNLLTAMDAKVILINERSEANKPLATQPSHPVNITRLSDEVRRTGADLGLAYDPDADLLVMVDNQGHVVRNDLLLQLLAKDHLRRQPDATIICDARCSERLISSIQSFGGQPVIGHTEVHLLRQKMLQEQACLAGDSLGHLMFPIDWHSYPDALYATARILQLWSATEQDFSQWTAIWPADSRTPEWRVTINDKDKKQLLTKLKQSLIQLPGANLQELADGIRLNLQYGWFLIRPSLDADELCMTFEAESESQLLQLQRLIAEQIANVNPKLALPF